jgi:hypothetical protein
MGCVTLVAAFQPTNIGVPVLTLTTFAADGSANDRVLARLEDDGKLYVSANHWPRAWYHRAVENPNVQVTIDEEKRDYLAVPIVGAEHERLTEEFGFPFLARILTGFPPRAYLRLDPKPVHGRSSSPHVAE